MIIMNSTEKLLMLISNQLDTIGSMIVDSLIKKASCDSDLKVIQIYKNLIIDQRKMLRDIADDATVKERSEVDDVPGLAEESD